MQRVVESDLAFRIGGVAVQQAFQYVIFKVSLSQFYGFQLERLSRIKILRHAGFIVPDNTPSTTGDMLDQSATTHSGQCATQYRSPDAKLFRGLLLAQKEFLAPQ